MTDTNIAMNKAAGIIGNDNAVSTVNSMIDRGRIAHSIVIFGDKGLGKKTLAKYIAAKLLCTSDVSPCGKCRSCKNIYGGGHPDFIEVKPSLKNGGYKRDDDLRSLVSDVVIAPNESAYKIYLIADMDNTQRESQNVLLKLIEEPPDHAVIILTASSKEYFLPTILSRVVSLGVVPVSADECRRYLREHTEYSDEDIDSAVEAMGGNIGMCLEYINDKSLRKATGTAAEIAHYIAAKSEYDMLRAFWICDKDKDLALSVLRLLQNIIRDACLYHSGCDIQRLGCSESSARELSDSLSGRHLSALRDIPEKYISRINGNGNLALCLSAVCAEIRSAIS